MPALPDFVTRYPEIVLDLGATDWAIDLVQEGVDCAIRVGERDHSNLLAEPHGHLELVHGASPDYLAKHGTPQSIADLSSHLAVNYASLFTGRIEDWGYLEAGERKTLAMRSLVTVNNAEYYFTSCLAGLGPIQIPAYDIRDDLAAGRLVEVLPDWRAAPMPITILYPHCRHLSGRLQVFVDWVTDLFSREVMAPR